MLGRTRSWAEFDTREYFLGFDTKVMRGVGKGSALRNEFHALNVQEAPLIGDECSY